MPRKITGKLTLLAGACALSLAFAPNAFAAGGGGMGGGSHFGGMTATAPMSARPMVAPMDHKPLTPSAQPDTKTHAPFNQLNNPSAPQPASTPEQSSHATQSTSPASRPAPVTGTRIPSAASQEQIHQDPPPPGHGSTN